MASLLTTWRIPIALLIAIAFVASAYFLARSATHPFAATASTETDLLEAIAKKDSDGDGLFDWEEALYGTDPAKTDTKSLGMTDGEAVAKGIVVPAAVAEVSQAASPGGFIAEVGINAPAPGSLTAAFARNFFALYIKTKQAKGAAFSEADARFVAEEAVRQLAETIGKSADFKTAEDITISGSGPEELRSFATRAEDVLIANAGPAEKSELLYLQDAVQKGDVSALEHIKVLSKRYRDVAAGFAVLSVPRELAGAHLALVNALARLGEISADFARVESDPLATMLALSQYPDAILAMSNAFIQVYTTYRDAGVELRAGEPGAAFVNVIPRIAEKQAAEKP